MYYQKKGKNTVGDGREKIWKIWNKIEKNETQFTTIPILHVKNTNSKIEREREKLLSTEIELISSDFKRSAKDLCL